MWVTQATLVVTVPVHLPASGLEIVAEQYDVLGLVQVPHEVDQLQSAGASAPGQQVVFSGQSVTFTNVGVIQLVSLVGTEVAGPSAASEVLVDVGVVGVPPSSVCGVEDIGPGASLPGIVDDADVPRLRRLRLPDSDVFAVVCSKAGAGGDADDRPATGC